MKTPFRLYIRYEVKGKNGVEYRGVSVPISIVNSNCKNFVRVSIRDFKGKRRNLYLCKDEDFQKFKPFGYWAIRSIVAKPENLNHYISQTLKLIQNCTKGFIMFIHAYVGR